MSDKANLTEIDKAIQQAKARKAARGEAVTPAEPKAPKAAKEPKAPRAPDPAKLAAKAAKEAARAAKKAERDAKRAAKAASTSAGPAHMKKVAKAAERLGKLSPAATLLFNEATANLTAAELASFAAHIQHFNRVKATERALTQRLEAGQLVTIVGGEPRYVGMTGKVTKAQRIRCYVEVPGAKKPIYLFTSDVVLATSDSQAASA